MILLYWNSLINVLLQAKVREKAVIEEIHESDQEEMLEN